MVFGIRKSCCQAMILSVLVVACKAKSLQNSNGTKILEEKVSNLENLFKELDRKLQNLNGTVQKDLTKNEPVMFFAIITSGSVLYLNKETTIVFPNVILNTGGHYNNNDGVFVAPTKGVYLFSWTVSSYSSHVAVTELVVENNVISSTGNTDNAGGYHSGSMTSLCRMNKDDHAFIRTTGYNTDHQIYSNDNYPRTSFLGMLVRSE